MIVTSTLLACALVAQSGWSISAGPERFSLRDISRSGPPADASPVAWEGEGPSFVGIYTREGARRFHRVTIDLARASSFDYTGPVRTVSAPGSDRLFRIEGRYEYRRYFLDDLFVRGLDVGAGVQGIGRHLSFARDTTNGEYAQGDTSFAIAGSVAARWHRSPRWFAEVAWVNGGALLHQGRSQTAPAAFDRTNWGGAWLTDLAIQAGVRLNAPWALSFGYLSTGEGTSVSHNSAAFDRRRIVVGVTYAR